MAFLSAFILICKDTLAPVLGLLTIASLFQSIVLGTHLASSESLYHVEPGHALHATVPSALMSNLLLGNRSPAFLFLAAFLVFVSVGVVMLEWVVLQALVRSVAWTTATVHNRGPQFLRTAFSYVFSCLLRAEVFTNTV